MRANTKSTMRNEEMYSYQEVKNGKQVSSFRFKEKHNLILKLHTLNLTYPSGSVASLTLFVVPANSTRIFVVDCSASPKGPTPRDEADREREESRKRREQYTCYRAYPSTTLKNHTSLLLLSWEQLRLFTKETYA